MKIARVIILGILFSFPLIHAQESVPAFTFQTGVYHLNIQMKAQAQKENQNVTLPAKVQVKDGSILVDTKGMIGNKIQLKGNIFEDKFKFGITEPEGKQLITILFLGKLTNNNQAGGDQLLLVDGKLVAKGKWSLQKFLPAKPTQ